MSQETQLPDLSDVPTVPIEADFSVIAFEWAWSPHPYMVSEFTVDFAAKNHRGELSDHVIREAERESGGALCAVCIRQKLDYSFNQHRRVIGMVIRPEVPDKAPNYLAGLKEWLNENEYVIRNELKAEMLLFAKYEPRIVRNR